MKNRLLHWGCSGLLLWLFGLAPSSAVAQYYSQYPADTSVVYSYVEQMPALRSGGGNLAIVKAIQQQVQLPTEVKEGRVEGRVFVRFVVGVAGTVRQASAAQSLSTACDAAALAAVRKLPRFVPGRNNGVPVAVLLTVPVVFYSPRHVYGSNEVTRAAQYPGGADALDSYVKKNQQTPAEVKLRDLRGRTTVRFVVRADGRMGASEVLNSLCAACDEEALRLVRAMPRWQPALGYDNKPVASYQAVQVWFQPPAPPAGTPPNVPESQVYTYAEQMPALPGGGGAAAISAALLAKVEQPARAVDGQVQVSFVVEPDGRVTRPAIVKSLGSGYDEAVLAATVQLPRFEPGRQHGQPVAVRLVVPVTFEIR